MDLTQLKTLIHVAELGSVSRAADRLNIAQPALSRQISLLEAELGVTLFDRHSRGMAVTATGRLVLDHAARVIGEADALRAAAAEGRDVPHGSVTVGMPPTIAQVLTVPLVTSLRVAAPRLSLRVLSAFSGYVVDWLRRGEIDVALSYNPQPSRSLRTTPVFIEQLLLIGPPDAGLDLARPVPFRTLGALDLMLPSTPHGLRVILDACAASLGITLSTSIEVDSYGPLIELVRHGLGYTVLPLPPVFNMVQSGALRAAPLVDPTPERELAIVYSADHPASPAAQHVGRAFGDTVADLVGRGVWSGRPPRPSPEQ